MQNTYFTEQDLSQLRHLLPPTFEQLIVVAGDEAAFTLVRHYSGTHIPIGQNKTKAGKVLHAMLAEAVGEDIALKIEAAYATQRKIYIPKCESAVLELRDRLIRRQYDDFVLNHRMTDMLAVNNLAREHNLTDRQIRNIIKQADRLPENTVNYQQIALF